MLESFSWAKYIFFKLNVARTPRLTPQLLWKALPVIYQCQMAVITAVWLTMLSSSFVKTVQLKTTNKCLFQHREIPFIVWDGQTAQQTDENLPFTSTNWFGSGGLGGCIFHTARDSRWVNPPTRPEMKLFLVKDQRPSTSHILTPTISFQSTSWTYISRMVIISV